MSRGVSKPQKKRAVPLPCLRDDCRPTEWCRWCAWIHSLEEQLQTLQRERDEAVEDALRLGAFSGKDEAVTEVERLKEQLEATRNELARERSRPGGSFDQWDDYQRLEEALRAVVNAWNDDDILAAIITARSALRLDESNPASAPFEPRLPCGHPESAVVQADEGTAYCGDCEAEGSSPASDGSLCGEDKPGLQHASPRPLPSEDPKLQRFVRTIFGDEPDPASESGYERTDIYKDGKFVGRHGRVVSNQESRSE